MKGKNILDCVNRHLTGKVFLKADIHAFFDSISYDLLMDRIKMLHLTPQALELATLFAKSCFYQDHLPLGFTSSPLLSDLYLVSLDRKYQKDKTITYSRYADDFIISSAGEGAKERLLVFQKQLEIDLGCLGIELNQKKTYIRQLNEPGDAIHVLGVNIVRTNTAQNRITISDRYIRETCKALETWANSPQIEDDLDSFSRLYGRISFIRQCSASSYKKLCNMVRIKCGYSGSLTADDLRAYIKRK